MARQEPLEHSTEDFIVGPDTWEVRPQKTNVPFGYTSVDKTLYPIPSILSVVSETFDAIDNGESFRNAHAYLSSKIEDLGYKTISVPGFHKLYRSMRKSDEEPPKPKKPKQKKTKEEREEAKKRKQLAAERRRITFARKRIEKLDSEAGELEQLSNFKKDINNKTILEVDLSLLNEEHINRSVAFQANPGPQTDFLSSSELEVLFGGAAGGGKSYAMLADPLRYVENPNFVGLLLRRTNDELRELKWKSKIMYGDAFGGDAKFREKESEWVFPSGARLWMSYLDRDEDVFRYHGQTFTWIGFDELTMYPSPLPWDFLRTRLRTTDKELEQCLSMRASTNPGGPGHGWVKKMFIDPAPYNTAFWATDIETEQTMVDEETGLPLFKRKFIPSRLKDNPYINYNEYRKNLLSQGQRKAQQLLEGDWAVADGAAFPEFRSSIHVLKPFEIPHSWRKFRSMDWGYQSAHAVHWFAIDPQDNSLICYREYYTKKRTARQMAGDILHLERGEKIDYGVLDSSTWHKRGEGPSPAEEMIAEGCRWRPSDRSQGSRVSGKNMIHQLLQESEDTGRPKLFFFDNCRRIIADLQVAPADPKGGDDIDERYRQQNHAYDSLRYAVLSRPKGRDIFDFDVTKKLNVPADMVFGY